LYLSATIFIIHYPKPFVKSFFEISQKKIKSANALLSGI